MNNQIRIYGIFSLILWLGFGIMGQHIIADTLNVYFIILLFILSYFVILKYTSRKNSAFYTEHNLRKIVFWYSIIGVAILNILYFTHDGTFFSYNAVDELLYDKDGRLFASLPFYKGIVFLLNRDVPYDDLGAILYVGTIYRIIESPLLVHFLNIIFGTISATILFRIGRLIMSARYAFITSLAFFLSSFIIYYESIGLKETFFLMLVLITFYNYYLFLIKRKMHNFYIALFFGAAILLFRPAVLGMTVISLGIGTLLFYSVGLRNIIISIILAITFISFFDTFKHLFSSFSSFQQSILYRSDAVEKSTEKIAIATAFTSSLIGPLPTILPRVENVNQSLYAAGLLMRVLLAAPFWFGVVYIIKHRIKFFYGFLAMILIESAALVYIMESYELRYHLFHLPFVFLIAFFYLSEIATYSKIKYRRTIHQLFAFTCFLILLVLYWNFRVL